MSARIVIEGRWCLTEDDRLVPEGDPDARWFWAGDGQEVDAAECERLGYGAKQAPPAKNKMRRPGANK